MSEREAGQAVTDLDSDRRLLALMFTDVLGYTAITERDEGIRVRGDDERAGELDPAPTVAEA